MLKAIQIADSKLFYSVFSDSRAFPRKAAKIVSRTADGWLYLLLFPLIYLLEPGYFSNYLLLALAGFTTERIVYFILKNALKRRRPPNSLKGVESLITAADEFSLPSGHTSAAFFFVTFLCAGFGLMFLPLYLWAVAVGVSRVLLGVHFPTDILAGAVIGTGIALALV